LNTSNVKQGPRIISTRRRVKKILVTPNALCKGAGYQTEKTRDNVTKPTMDENARCIKKAFMRTDIYSPIK
jgi:hypothetical protein